MKFSQTGFGIIIACAVAALAAGCGDEENPDSAPASYGSDTGVEYGDGVGASWEDAGAEDPIADDVGIEDAGAGDVGATDAGSEDASTSDVGRTDAGVTDGGTEDAGVADVGTEDADVNDAGVADAGSEDAGSEDVGSEDARSEDTGSEDTGSEDTGSEDTGSEDTGSEDTGSDRPRGILLSAFDDEIGLEDGQGTSSSVITVEGGLGEDLAGAAVSYSWNEARFQPVEVVSDTFAFELTLLTGENTLTVRAVRRTEESMQTYRTYFGALGARAGTHDQRCLGATSSANSSRCEEICEDIGGEYDGTWGNIGGCRNIPGSQSGADLDLTDRDAPAPVERATTHDQQCLGSTSATNRERCQEICGYYGGTYDADWGNIGGCRDMPGSALNDFDFTDGTIYPAEPARDTTHDRQCLGPTSAVNRERCQEICGYYGGTYDADWGNIGGCRNMPGSASDLDFTDGTIDPDPDHSDS